MDGIAKYLLFLTRIGGGFGSSLRKKGGMWFLKNLSQVIVGGAMSKYLLFLTG